jgi:hypothetical protein
MGKSDINVRRNNEATDGPRGKHVQEDGGHEQPKAGANGYTHTTYVKATLLEAHLVINTTALPSSPRKPLPHGINWVYLFISVSINNKFLGKLGVRFSHCMDL